MAFANWANHVGDAFESQADSIKPININQRNEQALLRGFGAGMKAGANSVRQLETRTIEEQARRNAELALQLEKQRLDLALEQQIKKLPNQNKDKKYDTFIMLVDSISLNKKHIKEFLGMDMNKFDREITKTIDQNDARYPCYKSAFTYLHRELENKGYKMSSFPDGVSNSKKDTKFPISIGLKYIQSFDPLMFYVGIRGQEHTVPNQKNVQLTYEDVARWMANKDEKSPMLFYEPLWTISLIVENELPAHSELLFISMIKCAAPYFNKNFKGIVTCKR